MANREELLRRLDNVYQRAVLGEKDVVQQIAAWKKAAKEGNPKAKICYNSLAALHWARKDQWAFAQAEIFYNKLAAQDRDAHQKLSLLVERKKKGDSRAQATFSTLKAVHHKRKASLWTKGPGSPSIGHYPMPYYHRPGIQFGPNTGNELILPTLPLTPQALAMLFELMQTVLSLAPAEKDSSVMRVEATLVSPMAQPVSLSQPAIALQLNGHPKANGLDGTKKPTGLSSALGKVAATKPASIPTNARVLNSYLGNMYGQMAQAASTLTPKPASQIEPSIKSFGKKKSSSNTLFSKKF